MFLRQGSRRYLNCMIARTSYSGAQHAQCCSTKALSLRLSIQASWTTSNHSTSLDHPLLLVLTRLQVILGIQLLHKLDLTLLRQVVKPIRLGMSENRTTNLCKPRLCLLRGPVADPSVDLQLLRVEIDDIDPLAEHVVVGELELQLDRDRLCRSGVGDELEDLAASIAVETGGELILGEELVVRGEVCIGLEKLDVLEAGLEAGDIAGSDEELGM